MRKLLALLLALTMVLGLAACGKKDAGDGEPGQEDRVEDQLPDSDPAPDGDDGGAQDPPPLLPDPEKGETGGDAEADTGENTGSEAGGDVEEDAGEEAVRSSHTDVTLTFAGETFRLSPLGIDGVYAASFTSADPAVATVDGSTGDVAAVAPGTTSVAMHVECGEGQYDFTCTVRCVWKETEEEPSAPAAGEADTRPSLDGFFTTLQGSYEGLGAMGAIEGEVLENYYPGLSGIATVEELLVQETMITTANVAVGLVKLSKDATLDDIQAVQDILQARINTQAEGGAWYPASCETWEQGVILSVNNCVGMFVYPEDAQEMADLFMEAFGS